MVAEKRTKQDEVYLTGNELIQKLGISMDIIYRLYNQKKVRYIFKKIPRHGGICQLIHFNLDDIRDNLKKALGQYLNNESGVIYRWNE